MHEVLVNRLGGVSLPRKSVVRLTDRPDMTLDVYRGRKTTIQQQQDGSRFLGLFLKEKLRLITEEIRYSYLFYFHMPYCRNTDNNICVLSVL